MINVFTIKLTHLATGTEKMVPITKNEFNALIVKGDLNDDRVQDRIFADILYNSDVGDDWYDHYKYDGIFMGKVRKDFRT